MKSCPACNARIDEKRSSLISVAGYGCLSEIFIWVTAGIVGLIFSICNFDNTYYIGLLIFMVLAVFMGYFWKTYRCNKCNLKFSFHELRKKI